MGEIGLGGPLEATQGAAGAVEGGTGASAHGTAGALLVAAGARISASNQADYERDLATMSALLGEEAFEAACREGRALDGPGVEVVASKFPSEH